MYAVIRTGGKQYRVAPGDVLKIESVASGSPTVEFSDVLAVSGEPGTLAKPAAAKVTAEVLGEGPRRQDPCLPLQAQEAVQEASGTPSKFHQVRIKAIEADGVTYDCEVRSFGSSKACHTRG